MCGLKGSHDHEVADFEALTDPADVWLGAVLPVIAPAAAFESLTPAENQLSRLLLWPEFRVSGKPFV
jgi:hypothetical protein